MYSRGGYVCKETKNRGLVFLEKDWDGGRLPEDLVEESGLIGSSFSIVNKMKVSQLGGYIKEGEEVHFLINATDYPLLKLDESKIFLASDFNGWEEAMGNSKWELIQNPANNKIFKLAMEWGVISSLNSFSFKFITEQGTWLEPPEPISRSETNELGTKTLFLPLKEQEKIFFASN